MKHSPLARISLFLLIGLHSCILQPSKEDKALMKLRSTLLQRYDMFDDIEVERSEIETKINGVVVGKRYLLLVQFVDQDISYSWNKDQIDAVAHFMMSQYHIKPLDSVQVAVSAIANGKAVQRTYSFSASELMNKR